MTILIQGLRRSGTSIVFDALYRDNRFEGYYEPFAKAKKVSVIPYYEVVKRRREEFVQAYSDQHPTETIKFNDLNYGAPREPSLEYTQTLPNYCKSYLQYLMQEVSTIPLLKFTRMHHKIGALREISPAAKLIIIARDPRAVVTSYLFGKHQKNRHLFENSNLFFERISDYTAWSYFAFSEILINMEEEYSKFKDCEDFMRVLIVWKDTVQTAITSAQKHFPDQWFLLRHHDLTSNSTMLLRKLYDFLELPISPEVEQWANENVRDRPDIFEPEHPSWSKSFEKLGMASFLEDYELLKTVSS